MAPTAGQRTTVEKLAARKSHASELSRFVAFYDLRVKKGRYTPCRVQCCEFVNQMRAMNNVEANVHKHKSQ